MRFSLGRDYGAKAVFAIALSLMLASCGNNAFNFLADKNSSAANNTAAQMALDSGDPGSAVSILGSGSTRDANGNLTALPVGITADGAAKLAAAFMQLAGLNTVTLAQNAANLNNSNVSTTNNFSAITSIFPSITAANLTAINNAIFALQNSPSGMPSFAPRAVLTQDQSLQLGIAEITASIIAIGLADTSAPGFDSNGLPKWCHGNCANVTPSTITTLLAASSPVTRAYDGTTLATLGDYIGYYLVDASINVVNATASQGGTNQIAQTVNNIVYSIQNTSCSGSAVNPPTSHSVVITGGQLASFINACLK